MPVQILPGQTRASMLGSAMGTGLGQGLEALAQLKMQKLLKSRQQKETTSGLEALGVPSESAASISKLPKELQSIVIKNWLTAAESAGARQAIQSFEGAPAATAEPAAPEPVTPEPATPEQIGIPTGPQTDAQILQQAGVKQPTFAETLKKPRLSQKAQLDFAKMRQKERLADKKQEILFAKEARKELAKHQRIIDVSKSADIRTIGSIRAAQSGSMRAGTPQLLMDKMGYGEAFRNPITEVGQKNLAGLALGVAAGFGPGMGRIMKTEFDAFVAANANKFNTTPAISYIGQTNLLINQLVYKRQKIRTQILKKNKNRIPIDFEEQVEKVMRPIEKSISDKMLKLNDLFATDKLPSWNDKKLNPARFTEGTTGKIDGVPMKIDNGFWVVDYDKL